MSEQINENLSQIVDSLKASLNLLWNDFGGQADNIFRKEYPGFNLSLENFLDKKDFNEFQESLLNWFVKNILEKAKDLKALSEKQNKTNDEINLLLKPENQKYLPEKIREKIVNLKKSKLMEKLKSIDSIFIDKSRIESFIKQENFFEAEIVLLQYIEFIDNLDNKTKQDFKDFLNWKNTEFKTVWIDFYNKIAQFWTLFNYDTSWIIPSKTKEAINKLAYKAISSGYLDSFSLYSFTTTEEGLTWLNRKTTKVGVLDESKRNNISTEEYLKKYNEYFSNLPWIKEIRVFMDSNSKILGELLTSQEITNDLFWKYEKIVRDYNNLIEKIRREHWYLPWEYLEMKDRLENIKSIVYTETPEWKHSVKMLRFLELFRKWAESEWKDEKDIQKIAKLINWVKSGEIKNFSDLDDSDTEDFLWSFFEDLTESMEDNFQNSKWENIEMKQLENEGLGDSYFFDVSMETLDKFVDKFHMNPNKEEFNFSRLESALAQEYVWEWFGNEPNEAFSMMRAEIYATIEKNEKANNVMKSIDPSKIKSTKQEMLTGFRNENTVYEDFLWQVSSMPRVTKEMILKSKQIEFTPWETIDKKVLEALMEDAAENGAKTAIEIETIRNLYESDESKSIFGENQAVNVFLKDYFNKWNWTKELAWTLMKEAMIIAITTAVTFWVWTMATLPVWMAYIHIVSKWAIDLWKWIKYTKSASWLWWVSARWWAFLWGVWANSLVYTWISDMFYEWDQLTLWHFTENFAMFFWGIAWAKIAWKYFWSNSSQVKDLLTQSFWWAIWATWASAWILVFRDWTEISLEEAKNMLLQWILMWPMMIPMMKAWRKLWNWLGNGLSQKLQPVVDRRINSKIAELEARTTWKKEFYEKQIDLLFEQISLIRDNNLLIRLWKTENKIKSLLKDNTEYNKLKKHDLNKLENRLKNKREELEQYRIDLRNGESWKTTEWQKKLEKSIISLNKTIANTRSRIRTLEDRLDKFIKDTRENTDAINALPEAHPLRRTLWEIANAWRLTKLWISEWWNNFRLWRLGRIRTLKNMWNSELWNGFFIKWKKTIFTIDWKEIYTLKRWQEAVSLQYLSIWNKRIPILDIKTPSWNKSIRLHQELMNIENPSIRNKILNKVINGETEIRRLYDKENWDVLWFKEIDNSWKVTFYWKNFNEIKVENIKKWIENKARADDIDLPIASSRKISISELSNYKLTIENKFKIKRQLWKELDRVFNDDVVIKVRERIKKTIEEAKNDPNLSPAEKSKVVGGLTKLAKMPVNLLKWLMKKWFWTIALWGTWILALDWMNDWDIDPMAITAWAATLIATDSDILKAMAWAPFMSKIPWYSTIINGLNDKVINRNFLTQAIFRWWWAIAAMHIADKEN